MTRLAALVVSKAPPPKIASTRFQRKSPTRPQLMAPIADRIRASCPSFFMQRWMAIGVPHHNVHSILGAEGSERACAEARSVRSPRARMQAGRAQTPWTAENDRRVEPVRFVAAGAVLTQAIASKPEQV